MKQVLTSKILRKLLILSCLVFGLVFVAASNNTQNVLARPLCSECPGSGPGFVTTACANECGDTTSGCYNQCVSDGNHCWRICTFGGGGGGGYCVADYDCPTGLNCPNPLCIGGTCSCE